MSKKRHTLSFEDLKDFEHSSLVARSTGNGEDKSLNIVSRLNISDEVYTYFTVEHKKEVILKTTFLIDAINAYNSI